MGDIRVSLPYVDSSPVTPDQVASPPVAPDQGVRCIYIPEPSDNPDPRFLEDGVSNDRDPITVVEMGEFSGSSARRGDEENENDFIAIAVEDHSPSGGRTLLRESARAMREFHAEQRAGAKEMGKEKKAYQEAQKMDLITFGWNMQEKFFERMMEKVALDQATPGLISQGLPPEVIALIRLEAKQQMTTVDLPKVYWSDVPDNNARLAALARLQHKYQILNRVHTGKDLIQFDAHMRQMVDLQEAANRRQKQIDDQIKKFGEEFAAQVQRDYGQDVREALKYPVPSFREGREALHYQFEQNTPQIQNLIDIYGENRRESERAIVDAIANLLAENQNGDYKQITEKQHEINFRNYMTLNTVEFKIHQNEHYNWWRDRVNQEYLKRLNKFWTDLRWRRDVANIPPLTLPTLAEHFPLEVQYREYVSWTTKFFHSKTFAGLISAGTFIAIVGDMIGIYEKYLADQRNS